MTDITIMRKSLESVLDADAWDTTEPPHGAAYETWLHVSYRWAVVLCVKGEMAGLLRVTELDNQFGLVAHFDSSRDWFTCAAEDLWLRLWESGAPNIIESTVEAVTAA